MERTREEIIQIIEEKIKGMTYEQKLNELKEWRFRIDMINHWDNEDKLWWNILSEKIKELLIEGDK